MRVLWSVREHDCCDGGGGGDVDTAAGPGCGSRAGLLLQYCARGFSPERWRDALEGGRALEGGVGAHARAGQILPRCPPGEILLGIVLPVVHPAWCVLRRSTVKLICLTPAAEKKRVHCRPLCNC